MFRGARDNEHPPGIRFLAVARQYDRALIASYRHDTLGSKIEEQQTLVHKVLGSGRATENHPRLTVTDREHGSLHYDSDREYFYITSTPCNSTAGARYILRLTLLYACRAVTVPDYPQRAAFKCLGELRERFRGSMGEEAHKAACDGLSKQAPRRYSDPRREPCSRARHPSTQPMSRMHSA